LRQLRDTVNSIETKWQLDVAVIVVIVIVVIVIVIVVVLNYAKIDARIRPSPSQITALS
jgi:heme/copper-type cytochrome/quinol oxidase subunit 2